MNNEYEDNDAKGRHHTWVTSKMLAEAYIEGEAGGSGFDFDPESCDLASRGDLSTAFMDVFYREEDDRFIVVCEDKDGGQKWAVEIKINGESSLSPT